MVSVRLHTEHLFWFKCEGCGVSIVQKDLGNLAYEWHQRCYTNDPLLVDMVQATGVADIYTYMAERIEVRGKVLSQLWVQGGIILRHGTVR